jgi:hypothetical protein
MFKNFKMQKKFFAFFTVVPLLVASALIKVPCPVCEATGEVATSDMRWVSITDIQATSGGVYLAFCGVYRIYPTDITIELMNNGEEDASGYLLLSIVDYTKGQMLDGQYVMVNVPAGKQISAIYNIFFQTNVDDPTTVKVNAKVVAGEIVCKACGGEKKVSLNSLPLFSAMKDRMLKAEQTTEVKDVFQPFFLPPEDWDVPYQYEMEVYDDFAQ